MTRARANHRWPRRGPARQPSRPLKRILNGGTEIEYFDDIVAGDVLESVGYIGNLEERKALSARC